MTVKRLVTRLWIPAGLLVLTLYGLFLGIRYTPIAGGSDSSGYFNSARLLAEGRLTTSFRTVPELGKVDDSWLTPLGFTTQAGTDRLVPTYPVGWPLHLAAAGLLAGWHWGPLLTGIAAAMAAVWLCYLAARELEIGPALAAAGATALATCPVFLFTSVQPLSDTLATSWVLAAIYGALRAQRTGGGRWSLFCGAATGIAVMVRPSCAVLVPALALLLGRWPLLLRAAAAGAPVATALAVYQHLLYGSALRSGYGDIFSAFSPEWFWPSVVNFVPWTMRLLPASILAPAIAFTLPWRTHGRLTAGLVVAVLSLGGFYAFYYFSKELWWSLRFILPVFPAVILLVLLGLEGAVRRLGPLRAPSIRMAAAIALAVVSLAAGNHWSQRLGLRLLSNHERVYLGAARWAADNLPPDALVACFHTSGALWFYSDLRILRYEMVPPADGQRLVEAIRESGRPFFAVIFKVETEDAFGRKLPGSWRQVADIDSAGVWVLE